ncbi:hypothetical protein I4U23_016218 [Adineta vaga]|nr:hypothetical protein I4U23_016218 [Adineta vaga]
MSRHQFLGNIDLGTTASLLTNYDTSTKINDNIKINTIKHQDDLMLIEVENFVSSNECDEIVTNMDREIFENMSNKYNTKQRNNSRLIVTDDQLAETLWQRLNFDNKLAKLVENTKPLGFNVQGNWQMSGINTAMRLNKYNRDEYFTPHKDAQYAPSGDERSLFSLLIYLTDNYEKGETKFYFPKISPKTNIKGLTIKEEINAYNGLEHGYECIIFKPKKGYAVLFTHNLLHEALAPELVNDTIQRFVLRTDILVKRNEKSLGFAVCPEEEEDYFGCLNFFREAQQNELEDCQVSKQFKNLTDTGELYERSLSIRYCYPRLLELKLNKSIDKQEPSLIDQFPPEIWLHIFKFIHEQDIRNLVFAYPQFQLLKLVWEAQDKQSRETDPFRPKFLPTIHAKYGSRTLFQFSDAQFFYKHINECCRVAAVYAFFLLGHQKDSTTYIVRYDRNTQEVSEVDMEKLLADAFYNRNCYGSLYRVKRIDENRCQPTMDLNSSVDRTYMTNRHQSQFIGQDLLPCLHFTLKDPQWPFSTREDAEGECKNSFNEQDILGWQRRHALKDRTEKLVDDCPSAYTYSYRQEGCASDDILGYRENLLNQTEKQSGTSLFRMLLAKDHVARDLCDCGMCDYQISKVHDLIKIYNHLIFDFDTHQLTVERLPDDALSNIRYDSLLRDCIRTLQKSVPQENPISLYQVNIEKLTKEIQGFNHASCQCGYPSVKFDQFSFLDYTHLSHVHLAVAQNNDHVFVLATYGGIAAL